MNHFRQSILFFGFVLPALALGAVGGGCIYLRGKIQDSYAKKAKIHSAYRQESMKARALEAKIAQKRPYLEDWAKTVSTQTISDFTALLNQIQKKLPPEELRRLPFNIGKKSGLGAASAQNAISIDLRYMASFRAMQRALLEMESRMPQLQVNALDISRSPQSKVLKFHISYTAWEK